jgi:ABC-type transport system involved in multi-copper enzyme maturation permease subunit
MTERPMDDVASAPAPTIEELSPDAAAMAAATANATMDQPAVPAAPPLRRPHPIRWLRRLFNGLTAVGVKELRGRMRGRRAFVVLTLYLVLLGTFAWMYELILEQRYSTTSGGTAAYASAAIGQELFAGLMMVVTLLVVLLAPAFTAGAISLEREKQTLDLLVTTPISSVSIVVGKLLSALTYVFILIAASIPMTAVVFVFGGVAPEDVIRGYIVLFATAFGLGAFGLFCSTLVKRTQAATVITTFGVMAVTLGSIFILVFWGAVTQPRFGETSGGLGPIKGRPPEAIAYLNPFLAQADVVCTTQTTYGSYCARLASLLNGNAGVIVFSDIGQPPEPVPMPAVDLSNAGGNVEARQAFAPADVIPVQQFGVSRNAFWPRSVAAWLVLSAVLIALSVQLVSPTRRWRFRLRRGRRRTA